MADRPGVHTLPQARVDEHVRRASRALPATVGAGVRLL